MFSSQTLHKDLNLPFPSSPFKEEPDLIHLSHHPIGSGLLRYRSAPSSVLGDACGDLNEAEIMFQLHHLNQHQQVTDFVSSGLSRQSSSPAGVFDHFNAISGFGGVKVGGKGQQSFVSRQNSLLSQISEDGDEGTDGSGAEEGIDGDGGRRCYAPRFAVGAWEGGGVLPDGFNGGKRFREPLEAQNGGIRNPISDLTHHFSLPKGSIDMPTTTEKFMKFHDAVPCKVRAKRGCATHPRSIAERVRRTKISERMRKLQELVPNMDKQTNTADMLDLAVGYIKDLQRQARALSESRANCTCSNPTRTGHI